MSESPAQATPTKLSNAWRFGRLATALTLVPFVRSCDDAVGLTETFGFPIPFAVYVNHNYSLAGVDWVFFLADAALLGALALLISTFHFAGRITDIRVFVTVVLFAAACFMLNVFLLFFLFLPATPIYLLFGDAVDWWIFDVLSRLLLVAVVIGAAYSVRDASPGAAPQ